MAADLDTILSDFEFLDDWEDRYKYVIDLGRQMPDFPDDARTEANKVRGCASQVWLLSRQEGDKLHFSGDSDAMIVSGLIAILLATFSGKSPKAILDTDIDALFAKMGLKDHLTQQRSNGFASMVQRIRADAASAQAAV